MNTLFLEQLIHRSEKGWKIKTALEDKANKIITILSIIIRVSIGISTGYKVFNILSFLSLIICILAGFISLICAIKDIKILTCGTMIDISQFFSINNEIDSQLIDDFISIQNSQLLLRTVIENYLIIIKMNYQSNKEKSKKWQNSKYNLNGWESGSSFRSNISWY
jgi:hypothetical protein